ncbi:MAG TPA: Uma2 family endonuclease [Gemmataceae bacterium]|jgi:Uma2 family endonuclease
MLELNLGPPIGDIRSMNLPYTLHIHGVTEEMFDELVDEDTKAELLDGVMIVHSPTSLRHDAIAGFLRTLLSCYADEKRAGRVFGPDCLFHVATCRRFAPDAFFLERKRVPRRLPRQFEGSPDFVIEVLSPSNRRQDVAEKVPAYKEAGIKEIWVVDPGEREVLVERRRGKSYSTSQMTTGKVLSTTVRGFWIDAAWLWSEPLPNVMACLRKILD